MSQTKAERARQLRYKRPALASMGYSDILDELYEIREVCDNVHWFMDSDDETLLNALDDDEEAEYEFRMAFADLEAKAEGLQGALAEQRNLYWDEDFERMFNDCTVALIGNRYDVIGFDSVEEDYFGLTGYEIGLATTEAGKRLMRKTKAELISVIGQCFGILMAFLDLRQQYDYLKATFDILRDENTSMLQMIKEIGRAYELAAEDNFHSWKPSVQEFNRLLEMLPQKAWVE